MPSYSAPLHHHTAPALQRHTAIRCAVTPSHRYIVAPLHRCTVAPPQRCTVTPPQVMNAILIYSLASAVGQNFIYYMITQFGPLELTAVTTVRRVFCRTLSVSLPSPHESP